MQLPGVPIRVCYSNQFHLGVIGVVGDATIRGNNFVDLIKDGVSGCGLGASLVHGLDKVSFPVIGGGPPTPIRVHNPSHPPFGRVFDCGYVSYRVDHLCHQPPHIPGHATAPACGIGGCYGPTSIITLCRVGESVGCDCGLRYDTGYPPVVLKPSHNPQRIGDASDHAGGIYLVFGGKPIPASDLGGFAPRTRGDRLCGSIPVINAGDSPVLVPADGGHHTSVRGFLNDLVVLIKFPIRHHAFRGNNPPHITSRCGPVHGGPDIPQELVMKQFIRNGPRFIISCTGTAPTSQTSTEQAFLPKKIR